MNHQISALIVFCLFILVSCSKPQLEKGEFVISGKVEGAKTEYFLLSYLDTTDTYVTDTIPVVDGSYSKRGFINTPLCVAISSNLYDGSMEDPNLKLFFLEPGRIEVDLKEGHFQEAEVDGSVSHNEYESFMTSMNIFRKKLESLAVNEKVQRENILDEMKTTVIDYASENPDSYISGYWLDFYKSQIDNTSLKKLYDHLSPEVQQSNYGKNIVSEIERYIVNTGDVAPVFKAEDLDGEIFSLDQLKGKTVLLDFGAGWCVPCKKNHPEIKRLYKKYHDSGLEIVGVSFDKDKDAWKENVKQENLPWYHVYDGLHSFARAGSIAKQYTVQPIPAYILIDKDGIVIDRFVGADSSKSFDKQENDLLVLEQKLDRMLAMN